MAKSKRTSPTPDGLKVIAKKSCPSLSGKSTITYHLGRDAEEALHIRLHENSGGGFFNDDWVLAQAIVDALKAAGTSDPVTSRVLAPLFQGRSANTPAFFAAVLRNEGVFLPFERTSRRHLIGDLDAFLRQEGSAAPKPPRKKPPIRKKKTSRKASPAESG